MRRPGAEAGERTGDRPFTEINEVLPEPDRHRLLSHYAQVAGYNPAQQR